jgi:Alpha galactosidase C-terminal beta sandwich domain
VIAVDQHSKDNRVAVTTDSTVVWTARPDQGEDWYVAVFNLEDTMQSLHFAWKDLGIAPGSHAVRDLWAQIDLPPADAISRTVGPHGCLLYRVK